MDPRTPEIRCSPVEGSPPVLRLDTESGWNSGTLVSSPMAIRGQTNTTLLAHQVETGRCLASWRGRSFARMSFSFPDNHSAAFEGTYPDELRRYFADHDRQRVIRLQKSVVRTIDITMIVLGHHQP